jgi:hypothetical protein
MKKIHLGSLILSAVSVMAMPAIAPAQEVFLDSTVPQVIQKIYPSGIVTFKNPQGESNDYYVPEWMFSKYDLKVGTKAFLFNRSVIQGKLGSGYVDTDDKGVLGLSDYAYGQTRVGCTPTESPASRGLRWGARIWFKDTCCFSTIPVVGSMSFYEPKEIVVEPSVVPTIPPASTAPAQYDSNPVRGLW